MSVAFSLGSIASQGWIPPVICVAYTLLMYIILRPQIKEITRLTFQQNKYEGNLRFSHTRIRTFAESIAFYGGETKEHASCDNEFGDVYSNYRRLAVRNGWTQFVTNLTGGYMGMMSTSWNNALGFLAVYFIAVSGQYTFTGVEDITTVSLQVMQAVGCLLAIPISLAQFSKAAGECHRYVSHQDL
jgi:ABC-type uncharacterized transport system fused permease/ATPase subunit